MKILMINGSPRRNGRTGIATRSIARQYGVDVIDLSGEDAVPLYTGEDEQEQLESVQKLSQKVKEADGIILASPEYHNGMSGVLKNALDFLGSDHFQHKPVALLAVAGGGKGGINALNNMRTVMRGLYANTIPRQLVLDPICFEYQQDSIKQDSMKMVDALISELKLYTKSYLVLKEE
ncbi:NADPH-dependent FMN reductase [Neobacillus sp. D3-1R]|uniref:NADPH-dependent FMN reductase n=1 Tax=Neobacillus sp. D3-1R TaxID=3445778 RepID=UPI003F9F1838